MTTKATKPKPMTPAEYGAFLAESAPPLTPEQVESAARILASVDAPTRAS